MVIKIRAVVVYRGWKLAGKKYKGTRMFYILIGVWVTWVYTFIKRIKLLIAYKF